LDQDARAKLGRDLFLLESDPGQQASHGLQLLLVVPSRRFLSQKDFELFTVIDRELAIGPLPE
jgi:hypothetical protein